MPRLREGLPPDGRRHKLIGVPNDNRKAPSRQDLGAGSFAIVPQAAQGWRLLGSHSCGALSFHRHRRAYTKGAVSTIHKPPLAARNSCRPPRRDNRTRRLRPRAARGIPSTFRPRRRFASGRLAVSPEYRRWDLNPHPLAGTGF